MKTEKCESFFNFFSPPEVPENEDDIDEDEVCMVFPLWFVIWKM